ncbi:uncharacterized protein MICPUCDRAFT_64812 [Micromonas pusilla CCMP1545]|uniref:Predicted protein n=1 Tax=Micromonas pusilla (strain CCMP1545) TaxID=564608 RepID=C1ML47_MICPC|nr:uncharacterized protein MICPUCDRAFT_64812 [Micromonas pusilla CCMP1545]EEH59487.1 predicted protein [Micromonas pusilla CCMP1545]|eukprot:XP_003056111.1 predicted protein [Micromonas pusilla CCMP1545]
MALLMTGQRRNTTGGRSAKVRVFQSWHTFHDLTDGQKVFNALQRRVIHVETYSKFSPKHPTIIS